MAPSSLKFLVGRGVNCSSSSLMLFAQRSSPTMVASFRLFLLSPTLFREGRPTPHDKSPRLGLPLPSKSCCQSLIFNNAPSGVSWSICSLLDFVRKGCSAAHEEALAATRRVDCVSRSLGDFGWWQARSAAFSVSEASVIRKTRVLCVCACLLLVGIRQSRGEPNVYYVAPHGSNSNSGTIFDRPLQSIGAAVARVKPGDTVLVMPGVYAESFLNIPGGTNWQESVRLAAYDPDDRPILRPARGATRVFTFAAASSSFIEIDGFVMDAANVTADVVKVSWGSTTGGSHDIRIRNSELKNAPRQGVLLTGHEQGVVNNTFTNLDIHSNGRTDFDHGVYISTPFNTVEYSRIHQNAGWAFNNYGGDPSHNRYFHNQAYGNCA